MLPGHPRDPLQRLEVGADQAVRLRAAEELVDRIPSPEDPRYARAAALLPSLPSGLREAVERSLLEVRRHAQRSHLLARYAAGGEAPRVSGQLSQLAERLRQGDLPGRLALVDSLVRDEAFMASPVLATRLAVETEPQLVAALARAVGILGGPACLSILKRVARSPERQVRLGAVEGLRRQPGDEAVRLLLERRGDPDVQVRAQALQALRARSPEALVELLRRVPRDGCKEMVLGALPVLESWGSHPEVCQLLRELGDWNDLDVLSRVAVALQRAGDPSWRPLRDRLAASLEAGAQEVLAVLDATDPHAADPLATEPPRRPSSFWP